MSIDDSSHLKAIGTIIRIRRGQEGIAVETLAEHAGLSHMTVRKIEDGQPARPKSYAALESAFSLPSGIISRALTDENAIVELAKNFNIDKPPNKSSSTFVNDFAKANRGKWSNSADQTEHLKIDENPENNSNYEILGKAICARRRYLGLAQVEVSAAGGPSDETQRRIERGNPGPYMRRTLAALERVLRWRPGAVQAILAGEDPTGWEIASEPDPSFINADNINTHCIPRTLSDHIYVSRDLMYRAAIALYRCATNNSDITRLADEIYTAIKEADQL